MKLSADKIAGTIFAGLVTVILVLQLTHSGKAQNNSLAGAAPAAPEQPAPPANGSEASPDKIAQVAKTSVIPPFILADTVSSSPDTNLVGNLILFSAKIGGTTPLVLQWKVDKGGGFFDVSPAATNTWLGLTNAQISDTGIYALFATNAAGSIHSEPRAITLVDGVD